MRPASLASDTPANKLGIAFSVNRFVAEIFHAGRATYRVRGSVAVAARREPSPFQGTPARRTTAGRASSHVLIKIRASRSDQASARVYARWAPTYPQFLWMNLHLARDLSRHVDDHLSPMLAFVLTADAHRGIPRAVGAMHHPSDRRG